MMEVGGRKRGTRLVLLLWIQIMWRTVLIWQRLRDSPSKRHEDSLLEWRRFGQPESIYVTCSFKILSWCLCLNKKCGVEVCSQIKYGRKFYGCLLVGSIGAKDGLCLFWQNSACVRERIEFSAEGNNLFVSLHLF